MVYVKTENIPSFPTLCLLNYEPRSLIRVRNSSRDLGSSLRAPSIQLVTVLLLGFCTPRITIHMCLIIKRNSFINPKVYNTMSNKVVFFKKRVFSNIYQFLKLKYNQLVVSILSQILTGMFAVYPLIKRVGLSALKVTYDKTIF